MAIPTQAERLAKAIARADAIQDELLEGAISRPDFSDAGRSVQFVAYRNSLRDELKELLEHTIPILQGSFEVHAMNDEPQW